MQNPSPFPEAETDILAPENHALALFAELRLLDWAILEAVAAHEEAKAAARAVGKPAPATWMRMVLQAQKRRMDLLGLPHKPTAARRAITPEAPAAEAAPVATLVTVSEAAPTLENESLSEAETHPATNSPAPPSQPGIASATFLNRAQRREQARQEKKRAVARRGKGGRICVQYRSNLCLRKPTTLAFQ